MADPHEIYTVVILPQPTAKGYQFHVSKRIVQWLGGTLITLVLLSGFLFLHYVVMVSKTQELQTLRSQSDRQQAELTRYNELVTDLKNQLDHLKEFDVKLRVMTNLNPPPATGAEAGVGGTESTVEPTAPAGLDGKGGREEPVPQSELETSLISLQADAARQEASFAELTTALRSRMAQWASTPSIRPVRGWLSSGFGKRLSPFTGTIMMHKGIDLATYMGTPVVSPADGHVEYTGFDSGLGRVVVIDHGHDIKTVYGHLSAAFVHGGQSVKRGETIATVGNTGLSTGPHLHYEVRINGQSVDPLRYIID
jgi:murein DD-endopeptidase MepM/ murein hydrolase activator NlpD